MTEPEPTFSGSRRRGRWRRKARKQPRSWLGYEDDSMDWIELIMATGCGGTIIGALTVIALVVYLINRFF